MGLDTGMPDAAGFFRAAFFWQLSPQVPAGASFAPFSSSNPAYINMHGLHKRWKKQVRQSVLVIHDIHSFFAPESPLRNPLPLFVLRHNL